MTSCTQERRDPEPFSPLVKWQKEKEFVVGGDKENSAEVSPLDINGSLRKDNRYESNPCLFLRYICTPSMKPLDSQL